MISLGTPDDVSWNRGWETLNKGVIQTLYSHIANHCYGKL